MDSYIYLSSVFAHPKVIRETNSSVDCLKSKKRVSRSTGFGHLNFVFWHCFEFRISNFPALSLSISSPFSLVANRRLMDKAPFFKGDFLGFGHL